MKAPRGLDKALFQKLVAGASKLLAIRNDENYLANNRNRCPLTWLLKEQQGNNEAVPFKKAAAVILKRLCNLGGALSQAGLTL